LARQGFHGTGMRQIASAAGVSIGAIYHHFKGKEELLFAIIQKEFSELKGFLEELIREGLPPAEIIRRLVERHFADLRARRQVMQVVQREWFSPTSSLRLRFRNLSEEIVSFVQGLLEQGMATGQIRPCNPVVAAHAILGMVMGITPQAMGDDEVAREIREHGAEELSRLFSRWLLTEGG
ncbi:TetR/AcrR family transcriptional regulator, partial [Candidatus Bipolaricaulota bacterium]|nr:TetR/AcrR family transcriptional regulator [Candidatus Bipolaricaulota bacterium]